MQLRQTVHSITCCALYSVHRQPHCQKHGKLPCSIPCGQHLHFLSEKKLTFLLMVTLFEVPTLKGT